MKRTVPLLLPVAALVAAWALWRAAPKDISYEAREVGEAYGRGDADAVYDRIFEYEKEDGLTRDAFRSVFRDLVKPRLNRFETRKGLSVYRLSLSQAGTTQQFLGKDGRTTTVELPSNLTPNGGRVCLLDVLKPAWYAEYVHRTGRPVTQATFGAAVVEGLKRDAPRLQSLGIRRFRTANPDGKGMTFKRMYAFYGPRPQN